MKYLLGDQWSDSFLDYYCGPDAYRIRVSAFANLEQLTEIYFVRPRSARLLWATRGRTILKSMPAFLKENLSPSQVLRSLKRGKKYVS